MIDIFRKGPQLCFFVFLQGVVFCLVSFRGIAMFIRLHAKLPATFRANRGNVL